MRVPNFSDSKRLFLTEKFLSKHYPEFIEYLYRELPVDLSFEERIYWFIHDIHDYPLCPICGNKCKFTNIREGYRKTCSRKCASISGREQAKQTSLDRYGVTSYNNPEKHKQTCLEKYGDVSYFCTSEFKKYKEKVCLEKYGETSYMKTQEGKDRMKQTCLERYGVESSSQSEIVKQKYRDTSIERYGVEYFSKTQEGKDRMKQTCLERYGGQGNASQLILDKCKQTCLERYGVESSSQNDKIKRKMYETKKRNHTFNTSKIENLFAKYLEDNNISFIRQYKNDKYPFSCDFYLIDKDIYLEINGHWSHGGHPFTESSIEDQQTLSKWRSKNTKFYNIAIKVWTIYDPLKRTTAINNCLHWYSIYTNNIEDLIKFCSENGIL